MIPQPPFSPDDGFDDLDLGPGPYDDPALSEENDDRKVDPASPLSRDAPGWIAKSADSGQWRAAQGTWAEEMAEVAGKVGQLKERLRSGPAGGRRRLALMEVADLGWWAGERVGLDQLILAAEDRLAGVQDQSQAFSALLWSVRRLLQPLGPGKDVTGIAAFLGRSRAGEAPGKDLRGIEAALAGAAGVHPIVRGAMVFHLWRASGTGGVTRDLEAAVLGARIAGGVARFGDGGGPVAGMVGGGGAGDGGGLAAP